MVEGRFNFLFSPEYSELKFDGTAFYKFNFNNYLTNAKGVDCIAFSESEYILMEIKDFTGYEKENIWRTRTDSAYIDVEKQHTKKIIRSNQYSLEESLDIEVSKKVAMTLACLLGANTKYLYTTADELKPYAVELLKKKYANGTKNIIVILFVEGDFGSKARSKRMIMDGLQRKISQKLSWLNCKVRVVDSQTHENRHFKLTNC